MKTSFSPLQLLSPVQLIFCLILFFLPWIELQCSLPSEAMKDAPKELTEGMKKEGLDPNKPISMVTQSGLQIATGGSSPGSDAERLAKSKGGMGGMNPEPKTSSKKSKDDDIGGAPLLFLFPVALVAGIGLGCVPVQHLGRRLALAVCCLGAFGVVGLQAAMGFPLEKEIAKQKEQFKAFGGGGGLGGGGFGGGAPDPKGGKTNTKEPEVFRVSWKIPLYLTFLLLLGATATAFLDGSLLGGSKKSKRRYRDEDEDEDDEDDEDDRPKKKGRDDDDERPRRKAKAPIAEDLPEDDDEPAPPRKKPKRRDEDDDDDRPRKTRRRDDD